MINRFKISSLIIAGFLITGFSGFGMAEETQQVIRVLPPSDNIQKQKVYNFLLDEQGIDVIRAGETRTLVIPSDHLFVTDSANFRQAYANNLKIIAQLINSYDTVSIAVTAYTDKTGDAAQALTDKQAQKVIAYLNKQGLDTRLIYAKGYGNQYPVALGKEKGYFNRRVEIKFQFYKDQGAR